MAARSTTRKGERPGRRLVIATGNTGKLREIREILSGLSIAVEGLDAWSDIAAPAETGRTFRENARQKAIYYATGTGRWCLADDSGLVVDALGGAPGVRSARYAADRLPAGCSRAEVDAANTARLMEELGDRPDAQRGARFICCIAVAEGGRIVLEADGALEGRIARAAAGSNGFGYDPVFELTERGCTLAELPEHEKNRISHRGAALRALVAKLAELLDGARG